MLRSRGAELGTISFLLPILSFLSQIGGGEDGAGLQMSKADGFWRAKWLEPSRQRPRRTRRRLQKPA